MANRPSGVGVLGFPTTTLTVRTGAPDLNRVSVRLAVDTSIRHGVLARTTLFALTQPAAVFGLHGSRTCSQQRRSATCGRAMTITHGASDGFIQSDGLQCFPGSRSSTAVRP